MTIKISLQSDNGGEFASQKVANWCAKKGILRRFSTPHHHQSNGRVERVIRTLRNMLNRTPGSLKIKLTGIVGSYNDSKHRGIGMCPNEAMREENFLAVKKMTNSYKREFKSVSLRKFNVGDSVILRNENRSGKNDDELKMTGRVTEICKNNTYKVKCKGKKELVRHATQMRVWPRDVGDQG